MDKLLRDTRKMVLDLLVEVPLVFIWNSTMSARMVKPSNALSTFKSWAICRFNQNSVEVCKQTASLRVVSGLTAIFFFIIMFFMRITATLEPEVEVLLREVMQKFGLTFTEALDQAINRGLADLLCDTDKIPFVQELFPMGLRAGYDSTHLDSLSDDLETDAFLDLSRHLDINPSSKL